MDKILITQKQRYQIIAHSFTTLRSQIFLFILPKDFLFFKKNRAKIFVSKHFTMEGKTHKKLINKTGVFSSR